MQSGTCWGGPYPEGMGVSDTVAYLGRTCPVQDRTANGRPHAELESGRNQFVLKNVVIIVMIKLI